MRTFKNYLLEYAIKHKSQDLQAILIIKKIIDMVDDGHVDYTNSTLTFNVGSLIHDKRYKNLDIKIIKSDKNEILIGRHKSDEKHSIFIKTSKYPTRNDIDTFLENDIDISHFKYTLVKYFNDANIDSTKDYNDSKNEKIKKLNSNDEFEKIYHDLTHKLDEIYSQYSKAKKDLENRYNKASNDLGEKEIIKSSLNKLKNNMLGHNFNEFKSKALKLLDDKFNLLNKEYKDKLLSRLENFYESKLN